MLLAGFSFSPSFSRKKRAEFSDLDGDRETTGALIYPEDFVKIRAAGAATIEQGKGFHTEHRIVQPDGTMRWVVERAGSAWDPTRRRGWSARSWM
jgi:hypothetical protein